LPRFASIDRQRIPFVKCYFFACNLYALPKKASGWRNMCATHLPMSSTAIIYNCLSGRVARVIDKERGVLATGWGALAANNTPDDIFVLEAVPHDWLLPQVAAVIHHGGAGTTGVALRAGKPTSVCPLVGDQPF
jgi:hypothetical protein